MVWRRRLMRMRRLAATVGFCGRGVPAGVAAAGAGARRRRRAWAPCARDEPLDVLARDAAAGAGAFDLAQVEAVLLGHAPRHRRRVRPVSTSRPSWRGLPRRRRWPIGRRWHCSDSCSRIQCRQPSSAGRRREPIGARGAAAARLSSMLPSTSPRWTVSPSWRAILPSTPAWSAATSTLTFSVSSWTSDSPASTARPRASASAHGRLDDRLAQHGHANLNGHGSAAASVKRFQR